MQGQASTARRDELLRYQKEAQKRWQEDKLFEVNAPAEGKKTPPAVFIITLTFLCKPSSKSAAPWHKLSTQHSPLRHAGETWDAGKFFGNFPYPYMNGMLHLGHAFSLSKVL